MTFKKRPLFKYPVPLSGMKYNSSLDWELACQWWGYKREEFQDLDVDEQARLIAVYMVKMRMDSVLAKDQADEMRRNSS